jgi:hypothetical protein
MCLNTCGVHTCERSTHEQHTRSPICVRKSGLLSADAGLMLFTSVTLVPSCMYSSLPVVLVVAEKNRNLHNTVTHGISCSQHGNTGTSKLNIRHLICRETQASDRHEQTERNTHTQLRSPNTTRPTCVNLQTRHAKGETGKATDLSRHRHEHTSVRTYTLIRKRIPVPGTHTHTRARKHTITRTHIHIHTLTHSLTHTRAHNTHTHTHKPQPRRLCRLPAPTRYRFTQLDVRAYPTCCCTRGTWMGRMSRSHQY